MNPLSWVSHPTLDAVARYANAVEWALCSLVGHSYGGAVVSEAAPAVPRATGLVFLSAFGPRRGRELCECPGAVSASVAGVDLGAEPVRRARAQAAVPTCSSRSSSFTRPFVPTCPPSLAAVMAVSQRPLSAAALPEACHRGRLEVAAVLVHGLRARQRHPRRRPNGSWRNGSGRLSKTVDGFLCRSFIARPEVATALILKAVVGSARAAPGSRVPPTPAGASRADDRRLRLRRHVRRHSRRAGPRPGDRRDALGAGPRPRPVQEQHRRLRPRHACWR